MVAPAVSAWITAFWCTQFRSVPPSVPLVLAVLAAALLGWASVRTAGATTRRVFRRRLLPAGAVCLALAAAVSGGIVVGTGERLPSALELAARSSDVVQVAVEVVGSPTVLAGPTGRVVVDVSVAAVRIDDRHKGGRAGEMVTTELAVPAVLFVDADGLRIGEALELSARVEEGRPGDREAFVLTDIGGTVERSLAPDMSRSTTDTAGDLRAMFVDMSRELPGDGGKLLPGLAVGDTTLVDDALTERMTDASLSHLTAVSGANCALVVGAVLGFLALCGAPRWVRVGGSLVALGGFVVLVTPEPSVVRAAVMAAIVLVCHGLGRRSFGAPVLFLAVCVCLLVDPWLSREFGFALSVGATAGLLFLAGPLTALLRRVMPTALAAAVALPLAAQLACQPIIVLLDPSIPLWGIPANMLAAPAAPVVTILGMASCLLLPVLPPVATVLGALAWLPSQWIAGVASATDAAPLARLPGAPGLAGVISATVVLVLVAVLAGSRSSVVRRGVAVALVTSVCGYLAVIGGARVGELWTRPADWSVAMCDVGQGDAVLVRSGEHVALVDTGPDPEALDRCLTDLGIGRIDLLVLSHFDADHIGGVPAVVGRAEEVLHQTAREADERALISALIDGGSRATATSAGFRGTLGRVPWRILWPPPEPTPYTGNDGSVVIEFGGTVDAVFLGDLGADSELALLADGTVGTDYAIVKFAHHGSADQYAPLYERISATLALVSCGIDNDYGHPTKSALALLAHTGTAIARSDLQGTTLISVRDASLDMWSG